MYGIYTYIYHLKHTNLVIWYTIDDIDEFFGYIARNKWFLHDELSKMGDLAVEVPLLASGNLIHRLGTLGWQVNVTDAQSRKLMAALLNHMFFKSTETHKQRHVYIYSLVYLVFGFTISTVCRHQMKSSNSKWKYIYIPASYVRDFYRIVIITLPYHHLANTT